MNLACRLLRPLSSSTHTNAFLLPVLSAAIRLPSQPPGKTHLPAATTCQCCTARRHASTSAGDPPPPNGPYVSKHFYLDDDEVTDYLNHRGMHFRQSGNVAVVEHCPFCHDTKGLPDNLYKLNVFLDNGVFHCFRCKAKGSWFEFRNRLSSNSLSSSSTSSSSDTSSQSNALYDSITSTPSLLSRHPTPSTAPGSTHPPAPSDVEHEQAVRDLWGGKHPDVLNYLRGQRGLSDATLKRFRVGARRMKVLVQGQWREEDCMLFPMYDDGGTLRRVKARALHHKAAMQLLPKGGAWGLFGLHTALSQGGAPVDQVVLTEGELDAMSVWQKTGIHSISLPNGAASLPVEMLPMLEHVREIVLWMDFDESGQSNVKQFARKLGIRRCLLVPPSCAVGTTSGSNDNEKVHANKLKDANDFLVHDVDMKPALAAARVVAHEGVLRFDDIRHSVYDHLLANGQGVHAGFQLQTLPRLNALLKGHRRGELTILSGHTGIGKTTLLAQLSLDYCTQGVATMWGSFEIPAVKLAACMLHQLHGGLNAHVPSHEAPSLLEHFDEYADKLAQLPLYFMRYHGSTSLDLLMDAMRYGNYVHDCAHFVLDNLQFMTYGQRPSAAGAGRMGGSSPMDKFEVMDEAVSRLRNMCTKDNVHVSLVVHPRKEGDDERIQMASIFGSAKSIQEADNVLIMQRNRDGVAQLELKKNRYDGELGKVTLRFDRAARLFSESDKPNCSLAVSTGRERDMVVHATSNDEHEHEAPTVVSTHTDANVYTAREDSHASKRVPGKAEMVQRKEAAGQSQSDAKRESGHLPRTSMKKGTKRPKNRSENAGSEVGATPPGETQKAEPSGSSRRRVKLSGNGGLFKR